MGFAFANFQSNPNTGELLAGSVYLSGIFFDVYQLKPAQAPAQEANVASPRRTFSWGGMKAAPPLCAYPATRREVVTEPPFASTAEADRYLQHIVTHEFGHVLGLRHGR